MSPSLSTPEEVNLVVMAVIGTLALWFYRLFRTWSKMIVLKNALERQQIVHLDGYSHSGPVPLTRVHLDTIFRRTSLAKQYVVKKYVNPVLIHKHSITLVSDDTGAKKLCFNYDNLTPFTVNMFWGVQADAVQKMLRRVGKPNKVVSQPIAGDPVTASPPRESHSHFSPPTNIDRSMATLNVDSSLTISMDSFVGDNDSRPMAISSSVNQSKSNSLLIRRIKSPGTPDKSPSMRDSINSAMASPNKAGFVPPIVVSELSNNSSRTSSRKTSSAGIGKAKHSMDEYTDEEESRSLNNKMIDPKQLVNSLDSLVQENLSNPNPAVAADSKQSSPSLTPKASTSPSLNQLKRRSRIVTPIEIPITQSAPGSANARSNVEITRLDDVEEEDEEDEEDVEDQEGESNSTLTKERLAENNNANPNGNVSRRKLRKSKSLRRSKKLTRKRQESQSTESWMSGNGGSTGTTETDSAAYMFSDNEFVRKAKSIMVNQTLRGALFESDLIRGKELPKDQSVVLRAVSSPPGSIDTRLDDEDNVNIDVNEEGFVGVPRSDPIYHQFQPNVSEIYPLVLVINPKGNGPTVTATSPKPTATSSLTSSLGRPMSAGSLESELGHALRRSRSATRSMARSPASYSLTHEDSEAFRFSTPEPVVSAADSGKMLRLPQLLFIHFVDEGDGNVRPVVFQHLILFDDFVYEVQDIYGPEEDDATTCVVCLEATMDTIFLPCRHYCVCEECYEKLNPKACPLCRERVTGFLSVKTPSQSQGTYVESSKGSDETETRSDDVFSEV